MTHSYSRLTKKLFFLFLFFALFLTQSTFVVAIGISRPPGQSTTVFYEPGKTYDFSYTLLPSSGVSAYAIRISDKTSSFDLSKYLVIEPNEVKNVPEGKGVSFSAHLSIPRDVTVPPGQYSVAFTAFELRGAALAGSTGASGAVQDAITLVSLENGKKLLVRSRSPKVDQQQNTVTPVYEASNFGTEPLPALTGILYVLDSNKKRVAETTIPLETLASRESRVVTGQLASANLQPGVYTINATFDYGGRAASVLSSFRIGTASVALKNIPTEVFAGRINQFDLEVTNQYGGVQEGVQATITVGSYEFKTNTISLVPFASGVLNGYFDGNKLSPGAYDMMITLAYGGASEKIPAKILVLAEGEKKPVVDKQRASSSESETSSTRPLVRLVGILILVAVLVVFMFLRMRKQ